MKTKRITCQICTKRIIKEILQREGKLYQKKTWNIKNEERATKMNLQKKRNKYETEIMRLDISWVIDMLEEE